MTKVRAKPAPNTATSSPAGFAPPLCAIFRRFLKQQGLKFTTERAVILDAVLSRDNVFEADQLIADLQHSHPDRKTSKATVYRTLKHLIEAGIITEVLLDSTRAHYQLTYGKPNVGHLVHTDANADNIQVTEFPTAEINAFITRICKQHHVEPLSHRLVIYATPQRDN
ncbi:MAG: transcriptional repressor [Algisphaera sp.]